MDELELPAHVRAKAFVAPNGEHAWRMADVDEAILAGRDSGMACLGGQVQFLFEGATCEAYWLNFDPAEPDSNVPWSEHVDRSATETLTAFRRLCKEVDFREEASRFAFIRRKVDEEGIDPVEHLWFVVYFVRRDKLTSRL